MRESAQIFGVGNLERRVIRDRATQFGLIYIEQLMQIQGQRLEVIFPSDMANDLVDDFIAVTTSIASRLSPQNPVQRSLSSVASMR